MPYQLHKNMKKNKYMKPIQKLLTVLFLSLTVASCEKEPKEEIFIGSKSEVEDYFTPGVVTALEDLGYTFNTGDNPPSLTGSYMASQFELKNTTLNENIGNIFSDYLVTFSNQKTGSIDLVSTQGSNTSYGTGSIISGDGNKFSVYVIESVTNNGHTFKAAIAISGTYSSSGIQSFQYANLMLDDGGDPNGNLMPNNNGRLLIDKDGLAQKQ